jgi:mRNA interferase RelE/StbE
LPLCLWRPLKPTEKAGPRRCHGRGGYPYARRLAPEPRREVGQALAALREERGDLRSLEANLSGYYRLRVGRHRILFNYAADGAIEAVFIEERPLVYEVFEAQFIKRLKS